MWAILSITSRLQILTTSSVYLDQKWSELNEKFEKILKNSEPEQDEAIIETEPVQPNFEQPFSNPEDTCGACGENYPEDMKFCPSCSWEELPC